MGDRHYFPSKSGPGDDRAWDPYEDATQQLVGLLQMLGVTTVAEVGCGYAGITDTIARALGPSVTIYAIDIDPDAFVRTQERGALPPSVIEVVQDVYQLMLPCKVDAVVCRFFLLDLAEPLEALRAMRNCLRPGGHLILLEPITSTGRVGEHVVAADTTEILHPDIGVRLVDLLEAIGADTIELASCTPIGMGASVVGRYLGAMTGVDPAPTAFVALPTLVSAWGHLP